jgi:hypothetical protein
VAAAPYIPESQLGLAEAVSTSFVGSAGFFPLMLWNLFTREPQTFYMVIEITLAVISVETLDFERDVLEDTVPHVDSPIPQLRPVTTSVERDRRRGRRRFRHPDPG